MNFTPGGQVEVARYDASGTELLKTRWTTATVAGDVRDWRDDPAAPRVGVTLAGVISAPFAVACGSTIKVRAYDQQTARWSNWLELVPGCEPGKDWPADANLPATLRTRSGEAVEARGDAGRDGTDATLICCVPHNLPLVSQRLELPPHASDG